MSVASNLERQMLTLINTERAAHGLSPVKLELRLNKAAEDHSTWMLNQDIFSHTGVGGSTPWDRMEDAGFDFSGSWRATENIAWQSIRGAPGLSDDVVDLHNALMNSPGHRANILDPNVTVVGIGIEVGNFNGWNAIMVTQNFARTSAPVQLDTGATPPPPSAPAPAPSDPVASPVDPAPTDPDPVEKFVVAGRVGSNSDDWFTLKPNQAGVLKGRDGDDRLVGAKGQDKLLGQQGDDALYGRQGADRLKGANGNDSLFGGGGNDILKGGAHNDRLVGGGGKDKLAGGGGNDVMTGGRGADQFVFSPGIDLVTDFQGSDVIILRNVQTIKGYYDLFKNHISQSGDDVIIEDGKGNALILEDTLIADLDKDNFLI
ncbi:CAP domain-containing protein [Ruegeria sp. HKCCD7255]|uniref:CAP domain-containing protein n=1 Tax=Ruegeria sp. HKCCD7255 TaxID=2683004 RepID=UPI0014877695|nr:CAP domain-containing protein [Ruegeria sp. HKCCD7255]